MKLLRRIQTLPLILLGASLALTLLAVWVWDQDARVRLEDFSQRLQRADLNLLEAQMAEKGLAALEPFAAQVKERREDVEEAVLQLLSDPELLASYVSGQAGTTARTFKGQARPKSLNQTLARLVKERQGSWIAIQMTDKAGKVVAAWPVSDQTKDLSQDSLFKLLSQPGVDPGVPAWDYLRLVRPQAKDQTAFHSAMVVAVGISGADATFAGLARVVAHLQEGKSRLLGVETDDMLKGIREVSLHSSTFLLRGNGEQLFHSQKGPFAETFGSLLGPDYQAALLAMQESPLGRVALQSYDGQPGLLLWRRVGSWSKSAGLESLLMAAVFLPQRDFKPLGSYLPPVPSLWLQPSMLLLLLAFVVPACLGLWFLRKQTVGLERILVGLSRSEALGTAPEGLPFGEEVNPELKRINQTLHTWLQRLRDSEQMVMELDLALKRVQDQASSDATLASQELSQLRAGMAAADAEKTACNVKFAAALQVKAELESQLANFKIALETAQSSLDLKASENKNLSSQIQDLMRMLEEQRKVAQQVQENAASQEGEAMRFSAIRTLSSELKATLTVIKNYISNMLGSSGTISDAQQEFLGVVINKSARLENLIGDLMEFSQIRSGIQRPNLETVLVPALIQETLLNMRPQADHKKIQLEYAESGSIPPLHVDKEQIGALFRLLLGQAIKVTSRNEKVSLLLLERSNAVEIRISDPGMSLPPDRAAKVFTQFHSVDSQSGPEFIGTGLRFPILKAITEAHGGKIWIESQMGRGKTFVVSLPKVGTSSSKAESVPSPQPTLASGADLPAVMPPPAASKLSSDEMAQFDSIFSEMPSAQVGSTQMPAVAGLPSLSELPGFSIPALSSALPPQADKPKLGEQEKEIFESIFGSVSRGKLPRVELKTAASQEPLAPSDIASFDAIFAGGESTPPPQLGETTLPKPSSGAFNTLQDLSDLLGGSGA